MRTDPRVSGGNTWGSVPFVRPLRVVGLVAQFPAPLKGRVYSTVTDLARFLGLSMSRPRAKAVW
jgi:hypothetical protein